MGFVDSLRMNNIYAPSGGAGLLQPNMNGGGGGMNPNDIMQSIMQLREQSKNMDENRQYRMMNFQNNMQLRNNAPKPPSALENIGQSIAGQGPMNGRPMNTAVNYPDENKRDYMRMTPYQQGTLNNAKEKNALEARSLNVRDQNADEERMIRQQRADTYSNIHDLTDAEKMDIVNRARAGDIQARAQANLILEEARQSGRESIQGMRGDTAMEIANGRNETAVSTNNARIAGQRDTANIRANDSNMNPTQNRQGQFNTAQEIMNTNPELAPFITLGPNGTFTIEPPGEKNYFGYGGGPTPEQYQSIRDRLYPPTAPAAPLSVPPNQQAPFVQPGGNTAMPSSRFKVTVR